MHIGFDASQTGSAKAGCGHFSSALIEAMLRIAPEHRYSVFPSFGDFYFDAFMPIRNPYPFANVRYGPRHFSRAAARTFWKEAGVETSLGHPDILHANSFWCPVQLLSSRLIFTLYDVGFLTEPAWTTEENRVGCFDGVFRSAMMADWVVAISAASRNHYLSVFPHFPEERIRVVYPCSRFSDSTAKGVRTKALKDVQSGRYWLNVGTIEPRKNQRRLAEAYARYLALGGEAMPLVFAGGEGWLMDGFQNYLNALGVGAQVVMTGYVSDDELIWLYRNCYANLYPSLFEGFGLPILEGMQFGAPTISSNTSSLPEVTGDAAVLLSPLDIESWAQAMLHLAENRAERDRLSVVALKQASHFGVKQSATDLLKIYEDAVASPKRCVVT